MAQRESVLLPVVGWAHLTNEFTTQFGIGHPENTGNIPILLVSLDAHDHELPGSTVVILPGEMHRRYRPVSGAAVIGGSGVYFPDTEPSPDDVIQLTYDLPDS